VESSKESKQLLIKISPNDAATLRDTSPEQIVKRLQEDASDTPATRGIIAAKQLPSGDVLLHLNEAADKPRLQANSEWTTKLGPSAKVYSKTFSILLHGVSTAGRFREDPSSLAKTIESENTKHHPGLKIKKISWLKKPDDQKRYSSLIVEVASAAHANRMITEGVLLRYEMKIAERFDRHSRVIQCFKCQQYGHTSHVCKGAEKCGNCGQEHKTAACTTDTLATPRRCAACSGANHPSWSPECPSRKKDGERARQIRETCPPLYPMPAISFKFSSPSQPSPSASPSYSLANSQQLDRDSPAEWSLLEIGSRKRRMLKPAGRPPKPTPVDPDFGAIHSFVSQAGSTRNAGESPPLPSFSSESFTDFPSSIVGATQLN
jgi:hypothetical protein